MKTCWDPLRRKEVASTPEEEVRQWFITVLRDSASVPMHMMMSEVYLKFGGKPFRADLLVYDRTASPLAIVECKRPEVAITADVVTQALRYDSVLGVRYIMLTNGNSTFVYRRGEDGFTRLDHLPDYEEMIKKI